MNEPTFYQIADQLHGEMESLKRKYPGIHTRTYRPLLGFALTRELNKLAQATQEAAAAVGEALLPVIEEFVRALGRLESIMPPDLTRWELLRIRFWLAIGRDWRADRIVSEALDREGF